MDFTGILEKGRFSVCTLLTGQAAWMRTKKSQFSDSQAENLSWVNDPVQLGRASGIQTENGAGWHKRREIGCQNREFSLSSLRVGYVTQVGFDEKNYDVMVIVAIYATT